MKATLLITLSLLLFCSCKATVKRGDFKNGENVGVEINEAGAFAYFDLMDIRTKISGDYVITDSGYLQVIGELPLKFKVISNDTIYLEQDTYLFPKGNYIRVN